MSFTFKVEKREGKVTNEELCMGVVSGAKQESISLQFDKKDFKNLFAEAGYTNIITLEGLGDPIEVTIKNLDRAPFTNEVRHVEFYALERGVEMNAEVPLVLVNESPLASTNAIINQVVYTVPISCRPRDLIQEIEVDMSKLAEMGDTIFVKDLKVSEKVTINLDSETAIVTASEPKPEKKEEEEITPAAEVPVEGEEVETEEKEEAKESE